MTDKRKLTLAGACGAHALQDGLSAVLYVLLPILAQTFGLGYLQVGIIRAANNVAMMLFEIPSGMLSERVGERSLLVFGLICAGLGFFVLTMGTGFVSILLSLLLAGVGAGFQHALSSALVSRVFYESRRRSALGVYNAAGDIGKLVFTGLFGLTVAVAVSWRTAVAGLGALAVLGAIVLFITLYRIDVGSSPRPKVKHESSPAMAGWGIRNKTAFITLGLIVLLVSAVQSAFLTFVGFLMIEKQVPLSMAAAAVVLTLTGGVLGKFGCGLLAERMGVIRSLVLVQCLTAVFIMAILAAPTLTAFVLLPVLGVVLQGSSSISYATVGDIVHGDRHSRGFAVIYTVSSAASVVGPIGFGLIGDHYGLTPAMLAMALLVVLPIPLCVLLRPALTGRYA